jgi:hypothetical protein
MKFMPNLDANRLYKEAEVKEQGTNINNHRKTTGSWKVTGIAAGIILLWYGLITLL